MHIISRKKLRDFWSVHPRARGPLEVWFRVVRGAKCVTFDDLKAVFAHADRYKRFVIFDIGGNKYRLIVVIHYDRQRVYIRHVLTHAEYSHGGWKTE